jgi:hypothetical protein
VGRHPDAGIWRQAERLFPPKPFQLRGIDLSNSGLVWNEGDRSWFAGHGFDRPGKLPAPFFGEPQRGLTLRWCDV